MMVLPKIPLGETCPRYCVHQTKLTISIDYVMGLELLLQLDSFLLKRGPVVANAFCNLFNNLHIIQPVFVDN